jgi:hypothetical protein
MGAKGTSRSVRRAAVMLLGAALCLCFPAAASAGSSIASGFRASGSGIVGGALVSLQSDTANTVELTTFKNNDRILGVASKASASLIEFSNGGPVQVVTNGSTATLVSDINGPIKSGDRITASPIVGVGMKATESTMVVGSAQGELETAGAETRTLKTLDGRSRTVRIGTVSLLVTPGFYDAANTNNSFLPAALQDFASSVAGHQVSPIRIMIAGVLVLLLFVVVGILLYSSVHSSIISIGRNPLSEAAIHKSLLQVAVTIAGILAFTVIVVYLILKF